jgi:two-component system, cell cycle sensor histidine kinase and response regulator CckA
MNESERPDRILFVEDYPPDAELAMRELWRSGLVFEPRRVDTSETFLAALTEFAPDLIISDYAMPEFNGLDALQIVLERSPATPFIVLTGSQNEETAVHCIKAGAVDYVLKEQMTRLPFAVTEALTQSRIRQAKEAVERALREKTEELDSYFSNAHDLFCITDTDGYFRRLNPAWESTLGYAVDDLIGQPYLHFVHPDDVAATKTAVVTLTTQRKITNFVNRYRHKEGKYCWIEWHATASGDFFYVAARDISAQIAYDAEREQLLRQIQEQAQRVQQIVDTLPEGMIVLDKERRIKLANPVARAHLTDLGVHDDSQLPLTVLGNRSLDDLLSPSPAVVWQEIEAGLRFFEVAATPLPDAPQPGDWVLVIRDVTQRREAQIYQQMQDRLATVGQLAAGIAHDFNNTMGVITLYTEMIQSTAHLSADQSRRLKVIHQQALQATNLINQILDFSRRSVMEFAPMNLLPPVKEIIKLLERTLPENIHLSLAYDQNQYFVHVDLTRLQQVLMNLAINARDAMPDGGELRFHLRAYHVAPRTTPPLPDMDEGNWLEMLIEDSGEGIRPEHLPHLFEPFFTTKEPGKGTGLGLAQVYGIIKQHGGSIDVESQYGEGSKFRIYLPLLPAELPHPTPETINAPGGQETILLVEDNAGMRQAVAEVLSAFGYQVQSVGSGAEALAYIASANEAVGLVLTDLIMPDMGGMELYETLQKQYPAMKVLIMSGYALEESGFQTLQQGNVPWIQKPFSAPELARTLRVMLE